MEGDVQYDGECGRLTRAVPIPIDFSGWIPKNVLHN